MVILFFLKYPWLHKEVFVSIVSNTIFYKVHILENLWIELTIGKIKYFVGGYYKHPKTPILTFRRY